MTTSEANISMSLHETVPRTKVTQLMHDLTELGECQLDTNRAVVSLVGKGMKQQRGVAAKMFSVLADAGINLEMICQGASELTVAIVIDGNQCDDAIKAVHDGMMFEQ